jgi:hypothetical protein
VGRFQGSALVSIGSLYVSLAVFFAVHALRSEGIATAIGFLTGASLGLAAGASALGRYGRRAPEKAPLRARVDVRLDFLLPVRWPSGNQRT